MNSLLLPLSRFSALLSARRQKASRLWDPLHWDAGIDAAGRLVFDGVVVAQLAQASEHPLLAVSRRKLLADARRFMAAVKCSFPGGLAAFSYKTNCVPGVLRELHGAGLGAEVISPYELWLAEKLGVAADRIVVNGVNKNRSFLEHAVRLGVASINVDHGSELDLLEVIARGLRRKPRVALRLKVDRHSHFGLGLETGEAYAAARRIAAHPDLFEFAGLHFHALADSDDPAPHAAYIQRALAFASDLKQTLGLPVRTLNIGGGYTVPTMKVLSRFEYARQRLLDVPAHPPDPGAGTDIETYFAELAEAFRAACRANGLEQPRLLVEPGRIVTSQSHMLLTRVHAIKASATGPEVAMTDAGKILAARPCDYEYHQIFVANRMLEPCDRSYHLMGRLCTAADWLAKNRCLPKLGSGDVLAVMDAGAYFTSYASNFAFPRPEIVMLDDGRSRTLRHGESFEHLTAMDTAAELRRPERRKLRVSE
jgi:diaminopimelate decarboxylase